jgi:hypothetical protein
MFWFSTGVEIAHSVLKIDYGLAIGEVGFYSWQGREVYLYPTEFRPVLGPKSFVSTGYQR